MSFEKAINHNVHNEHDENIKTFLARGSRCARCVVVVRTALIRFNVAVASQQIGFSLDKAGLVAPLPEAAGAPVETVDVVDVTPTE